MKKGESDTRKEIILEGAGSQWEDWREAYVEKLTTQFPKAMVLPMGQTIKIARRGQRVWIALKERNSNDVEIVTSTRATLILLGVAFFILSALTIVTLISSYHSYLTLMPFFMQYPPAPSPISIIAPYIPFIVIFSGLGIGVMKTNKTQEMQSLALRLAQEIRSFQPALPTTPVSLQTSEQERNLGNYCMYCGTPVDRSVAKFCENCGNSLFF